MDAIQAFISHHVLHHTGSATMWNVPFGHVGFLEWFHYDAVMLFFIAFLLAALGLVARRHAKEPNPRGMGAVLEMYVLFIRDSIVYPNLGPEIGRRYLSFFCTLFTFILFGNLLGLIPIFSTMTGNVSVTAGLATIFMGVSLFAVVRTNGIRGLASAFAPKGLPGWLAPFMTLMEIVSFLSRSFALTIRLFCNMLAGHIVIYSLLGLVLIFGWAACPAILIAVLMFFFEVFVACLQAYIFTLLSVIFINMMVAGER